MGLEARRGHRSTTVVQGEFAISRHPDEVLSTVLGSCVAVCLHDPFVRVGGMNHFLLPSRSGTASTDIRFGAHAMELLINGLLKCGAWRDRLQAKVFGGSAMSATLSDIGQANITFARQFLADDGIPIVSESLGGRAARRVKYWPASGRAQLLTVPNSPDITPMPNIMRPKNADAVTLF